MRPTVVGIALACGVLLLAGCSTPAESHAPAPAAVDYDLGSVVLDGGGKEARLPVRGTIAIPPRPQGAPVAVLLHLRGLPCTDGTEELPCGPGRDARYDQGMGWLASALAARGYVAIVPDITETRDFRYEARTVPLGWELAAETLARVRRDPAAVGIPEGVDVSDTTVAIGHSVGGDNAMWWAAERPADIAAVVLLQPAPSLAGLVPAPASPLAYAHDLEQTSRIPTGLPFAVAMGRCDDDAGYLGGMYTVDATVDPERTAMTVTAILPTADHLMMNTRALRETDPPQTGCPEPTSVGYSAIVEATRSAMGAWTADVLDVFLDAAPSGGAVARRAGIDPSGPGRIDGLPDASVIVMPPAAERTTVLLPIGGALGVDGPGGVQIDDPTAGAIDGVTYRTEGLEMLVCPAGGILPDRAPALVDCGQDRVERPGLGPALLLRPTGATGIWTADLPTPISGELLLTLSVDPSNPPTGIRIRAGASEASVEPASLAVESAGASVSDRSRPVQVRMRIGDPTKRIEVSVDAGAVFLQDVVVVVAPRN